MICTLSRKTVLKIDYKQWPPHFLAQGGGGAKGAHHFELQPLSLYSL